MRTGDEIFQIEYHCRYTRRKDRRMRTRILYEIIQIGNLIASPRFQWTYLDGDMAKVTAIYAWWYRPVIAFGFWLAGSYPE